MDEQYKFYEGNMKITINNDNNGVVVHVAGRLDSDTAIAFEKDLAEYLESPTQSLIIDFADLDYISSAGLRVIMKTGKVFNNIAPDFMICCMQDHIIEIFEISGFDNFVTICDDLP